MKKWLGMKNIAAILLMALVVTTLGGCGAQGAPAANPPGTSQPAAAAPSGASGGEKSYTIRLANAVQNTMPAGMATELYCKLIEERTEGRITVQFFPSRQLGETDELMSQVVNGTLEIAQISNANISAFTKLLECVQYPFLLNTYDKLEKAMKSDELKAIYDKVGEIMGVKVLTGMEHGMRYVANNVRPVKTLADFKGLKIRAANSDSNFATITALGANPVSMPYGQVYSGLQSKVLDGEEINYTSMYSEKHYEVVKYFTDLALWPYPCVLLMSGKFWNELSADDQKLFMEVAEESFEYNLEKIDEMEKQAVQVMKEKGVQIDQVDDAAPLIEATAPVIEEYGKSDPLVEAFIKMARGL